MWNQADIAARWAGWNERIDRVRGVIRPFRKRIALFFAIVGPGLIVSNVDNDAGGIYTYAQSGAQFGNTVLWTLIPMTLVLYVSLAAVLVWVLVVHGSAKWVERIFLTICVVYFSYVISAFLAKPEWLIALLHLLPPHLT